MTYNGFYVYNGIREPILINNDGEILTFQMYGVEFEGTEFSDFSIQGEIPVNIKEKCEFTEVHILNRNVTELMLCNCSFETYVPQIIIDSSTLDELNILLEINYILGKERPKPRGGLDKEEVYLTIEIDGVIYSGKGGFFEDALDQIKQQFNNKYFFKNCYGCLYSDYSIYGQTSFGGMQCHVKNKDTYLSARDKGDYSELKDYDYVQETYICDKYTQRIKGTGYRG